MNNFQNIKQIIKANQFICICLFLIILFFNSCKPEIEIVPQLIVAKEELLFNNEGGTDNLAIKSNLNWSVSSSENWCLVTPAEGEAGTKKLTITVSQNTSQTNREAELTIVVDTIKRKIKVLQALKNILVFQQKEYNINAVASEINVNVESVLTPEFVIKSDWIKLKTSTSDGKIQTFSIDANNTTFARIGKIYYTSGNLSDSVIVTQNAVLNNIPADETGMTTPVKTLASRIFMGWNLGNTLEVPGNETGWGNPKATQLLIDSVKAAGFNAVRLPCAWNSYLEDSTTYKIKESWLARVKEVVNYCYKNNMYIILNIHWDGGWLENNCTVAKQAKNNAKQKAIWEQIAVYMRDFDEHLLFAGANEPNVANTTEMSVLMTYHQSFVNAVRSTGGKNAYRILVIQGPSTDIDKTNTLMTTMPSDNVSNRLMAEIHYYTPWNFCGMSQDESWGKMFYYWGNGYHSTTDTGRNATYGEETDMNQLFGLMKTKFVDKGIPVVLGEFGALKRSLSGDNLTKHLASRAYFYECVVRQAKNNGLIPFLWDTGINNSNDMGVINRNSGAIGDRQAYNSLKKGANEGNYPF